jgi:hypothetical protein
MLDRPGNPIAQRRTHVAAAALLMSMIAAGAAWPQAGAPPPTLGVQTPAEPAPQPGEPASPKHEENPGLLDEIGKIFDKLPSLKGTQERMPRITCRGWPSPPRWWRGA